MKNIQHVLTSIVAMAFVVSLAGCASQLEEHKRIAYSAGFKVITPVKPDQVALLPTLPKDQVTPINYHGKTYFILPDAKNHQAFVGGPIEFREYQRLCMKQQISSEIQAAEHAAAFDQMNWGAWGGWGTFGSYGRVARYGLR